MLLRCFSPQCECRGFFLLIFRSLFNLPVSAMSGVSKQEHREEWEILLLSAVHVISASPPLPPPLLPHPLTAGFDVSLLSDL